MINERISQHKHNSAHLAVEGKDAAVGLGCRRQGQEMATLKSYVTPATREYYGDKKRKKILEGVKKRNIFEILRMK